ncbi:LysR family transcriptional regulator [Defluviimonas sp. 20V17]|uniref:LysR family transcriptional regulator n=1 Tax=Allgaiera indica TaxID=765699 RepID=A0AAN4UTJ4_9RHOB|nr:LysR family transcriptional regulator [Allgaiera indica]KDB05642.1 LysR family transcriptional regulator [Defluviimonas sp. 20V17]GHE04300.1 LysR family transcriptional regulator [Allgaiera indica]SDX39488.1 transcriptional regulator, LysR family [Allgaiera indica]
MTALGRLAVQDLRLLRALVAVAHTGNVTRAAELLNLTQPALSVQLRKLSDLTDLTLFQRNVRGLRLTADGEMLAAKAETVLDALQEFDQLLRTMRSQLRGTLRIGTIIDPEFTRLGALLQRLLETAPQLSTSLRHGVSGEVLDQIGQGQLDVGFYLGAPAEAEAGRFHGRHLARLRYRVVAAPPLAQRARGMDWAQLARLPWVGTPPASVHNRLLGARFAACGVQQNVVAQVDQEASMLAMARTGVGLSLCRDLIALHEAQSGSVVILDQQPLETELTFQCQAARADDPVIAAAFRAIDHVWGH